ncbi:MAG: glycosyltransferase [Pseudomonadota bacterium]
MRGGGAERVMLNLAKAFASHGIKVDLVLAQAVGEYVGEVPPQINIVDLHSSGVFLSLPRLVKYLSRSRPFAMLATQVHANVVALWAKRLSRSPTRLIVREAISLSYNTNNQFGIRSRLMPYFAKHSYPWADGVVAVSKGLAQQLEQKLGLDPKRIQVIYNPVSREELLRKAKADVDHPWFKDMDEPVVLSAGRLTRQKDFATLIRAFALVRRKLSARLVILGEGELRGDLEALVRELGLQQSISLPGFKNNPYPYMARASVYVLSSVWEGMPNAAIEAMVLGTPVIATDCETGPNEVLGGGKYGTLVPVGDSRTMAHAIADVITNRSNKRPSSDWFELFSLEDCVNKYLHLLQQGRTLQTET